MTEVVYRTRDGVIHTTEPDKPYEVIEVDDEGFFTVIGYGSPKHSRKSNEDNQLPSRTSKGWNSNSQRSSNKTSTRKKDSQKRDNTNGNKPTSKREANPDSPKLDYPTRFRLPNGKTIILQRRWEFYKWQYWKYTVDNETRYLRQDSNGDWEAIKFSGKSTIPREIDDTDSDVIALLEIYGKVMS